MHNTFDVSKVPLASFHLERESPQWFCWYIKDHEEPQWIGFFQLILHRFGPSGFDEFTGALTKLHQTGTVREYQTEFEKLVKQKDFLMHSTGVVLSVVLRIQSDLTLQCSVPTQ